MELLAAQKELTRRCYWWSLQLAEQQARTDYLLLRPLSNPNMHGFLALVEPLDLSQRLLLAQALVKRVYFAAPKEVNIEKVLEDQFVPEERQLAEQYLLHMRQFTPPRPSRWAVREECSPTKAKRLTKAVISHLSEVLHMDFVREEAYNWKGTILVGDWEAVTEFYFSGKGVECEHWFVRRDDPQIVSACLDEQFLSQSRHFDFIRRLGIGPTWWIVDCEQDVPAALDSIAAICTQISEQVPKLLESLGVND